MNMSTEVKPTVSKEETFDRLEIRLGRVLSARIEPSSPKKAYRLEIDFGKFGRKTSVGRFTQHGPEELVGRLVIGVLNFEPRQVGEVLSEVLVLGVQYPKAESGEATFLTPAVEAKIGGKVF
jgi:tRNA-binding protein